MPIPVTVPLLNANEPEARLISIHAAEGQQVNKGDLLFTIETTKAAADVESPETGFLRMVAAQGDTLSVGAPLAYITSSPDELPPTPEQTPASAPASAPAAPDAPVTDLRITRPARQLAETLGLDLSLLPHDRLVTEAIVREFVGQSAPIQPALRQHAGLLIYGAGGHAKAVMEMARAMGVFRIMGIIDDNPALVGTKVLGIPVLGTRDALPSLYQDGARLAANGVGGIIDINVRVRIFELLASQGFIFPALSHPRATVEPSALLSDGVQVFANAYVGSSTFLHERCMINTGAIVSHDCEIGAYTHIAPGAMLAGHVHVGAKALVGMGVTTAIGISIGDGARVGNGAILLSNVPARAIVPAGKVWTT